jgi:hypothetical protein
MLPPGCLAQIEALIRIQAALRGHAVRMRIVRLARIARIAAPSLSSPRSAPSSPSKIPRPRLPHTADPAPPVSLADSRVPNVLRYLDLAPPLSSSPSLRRKTPNRSRRRTAAEARPGAEAGEPWSPRSSTESCVSSRSSFIDGAPSPRYELYVDADADANGAVTTTAVAIAAGEERSQCSVPQAGAICTTVGAPHDAGWRAWSRALRDHSSAQRQLARVQSHAHERQNRDACLATPSVVSVELAQETEAARRSAARRTPTRALERERAWSRNDYHLLRIRHKTPPRVATWHQDDASWSAHCLATATISLQARTRAAELEADRLRAQAQPRRRRSVRSA